MDAEPRVDVVRYPDGQVKAVPAGKGRDIVRVQQRDEQRSPGLRTVLTGVVVVVVLAYSVLIVTNLLAGVAAASLVVLVSWLLGRIEGGEAELLEADVRLRDASEQWHAMPVSEVEEATAGWDDRTAPPASNAGDREREAAER